MLKNNNPDHKLTAEEARRGGKKSVEVKRKKKSLAELANILGGLPITDPKGIEILKKAGVADEDMISDMAKMYRLDLKARIGDLRAIELNARLRGQFTEKTAVEVREYTPLVDLRKRKKNDGVKQEAGDGENDGAR